MITTDPLRRQRHISGVRCTGLCSRGEETLARLPPQKTKLLLWWIDVDVLSVRTDSECWIEGGSVPIAPTLHLSNQELVSKEQCRELACPSTSLGVLPVTRPVEYIDIPEAVQLPVLAEEVSSTEKARIDVPDPQVGSPPSVKLSKGAYPRQHSTGIRG